jgi:hypothetical protein
MFSSLSQPLSKASQKLAGGHFLWKSRMGLHSFESGLEQAIQVIPL